MRKLHCDICDKVIKGTYYECQESNTGSIAIKNLTVEGFEICKECMDRVKLKEADNDKG